MKDIEELWEYACSGNIEKLRKYYNDGGSINNRCFKFGEAHSLIMGAFRNNQFDTIEYLISVGEEVSKKEYDGLYVEMRKIDVMRKLIEQKEQCFRINESQSM